MYVKGHSPLEMNVSRYEDSYGENIDILSLRLSFLSISFVGLLFSLYNVKNLHCKKIRRFHGIIPGIRLPVLLPLFLRAFTCRTFLEIMIWLTDSTRKYLCRIIGLYDKITIMSFTTVLCPIPENIYGRL